MRCYVWGVKHGGGLLLHRHLDDDLVDLACADKRGVHVVREEDHELSRMHGDVAVGRVGEELDVLLGIVRALRLLTAGTAFQPISSTPAITY